MLEILADVAREVIAPKFRALVDGDVEQKGPGDFVTVADRAAEEAIVERILKVEPGALLVGEESTFLSEAAMDALPDADLAYTIDPIDGTSNFVRGHPDYAVMVAEVRRGVTTRTWIWQPEDQTAWIAERGAGLYRNGERVPPVVREGLPVGAASNRRYQGADGGGRVAPVVRTAFSAGFDYPNVVSAITDYVYYKKLRPWDHLPGALMLAEVGGVSRTRDGRDYVAGNMGPHLIAAATPEIWDLANATFPTA